MDRYYVGEDVVEAMKIKWGTVIDWVLWLIAAVTLCHLLDDCF